MIFLYNTGHRYNNEICLKFLKLLRDHFNNVDTSAVTSFFSKEGVVVDEDNRKDNDSGDITDNDDGNINSTISNIDLAQEK